MGMGEHELESLQHVVPKVYHLSCAEPNFVFTGRATVAF